MTESPSIPNGNIGAFIDKASDMLGQIQARITSYAPDAKAIALRVVRINCLSDLQSGIALAIGAYIGYRFCRFAFSRGDFDEKIGWFICGGLAATVACIFFIVSACYLLDTWTYVGLVHPELKMANDIYQAVLRK